MAIELLTSASQLRLMPFNTQRLEQLRTGGTGELLKVQTQSRGTFVIGKISNRQACRNYTESFIERRQLPQKSLERRFAYSSFLRTGRVLERLQAIENQQGSPTCNEFR